MVVGALLAAATGVVGASVVAMGMISLPVMLRYGTSKELSAGVITAAGTLGQIIPPSVVLVVLADQLPIGHRAVEVRPRISHIAYSSVDGVGPTVRKRRAGRQTFEAEQPPLADDPALSHEPF